MQPVRTAICLIWLVISASGFSVDREEHSEGNGGDLQDSAVSTENSSGLQEDTGGGTKDNDGPQDTGDGIKKDNNGGDLENNAGTNGERSDNGAGSDANGKHDAGDGKLDVNREHLLDNGEEEKDKENNGGIIEDNGEDAEDEVEGLENNGKDAKNNNKHGLDNGDVERDSKLLEDDSKNAKSIGEDTASKSNQLLVIILDGFRWDYFDQQPDNLTGLQSIFHEGVRAKWVTSIFPSVSYPCWTTLSTGMYAESHGIINNYMYDVNTHLSFCLMDNTTTLHPAWWRDVQPIWTTVTKHGKRAAIILFSRCDVPIDNIVPEICENFYIARTWQTFEKNLYRGLQKIEEGFDLVMVYGEHLDNMGHDYGPTSPELQLGVQEIDAVLLNFKEELEKKKLNKKVNVVITSDHGMEAGGVGSGMQYVKLEKYLNLTDVHKMVYNGVSVGIHPYAGRKHNVITSLNRMPGVQVYASEDLPDHLHYKHGTFVPDVMVIADPGICIWGIHSKKQLPNARHALYNGFHGRFPENPDMRTVFYAWGPDFKKNYVHSPIHLVDIYQVFMYLLKVPPEPHNGTWENVEGMFTGAGQTPFPVDGLMLVISVFLVSKIFS